MSFQTLQKRFLSSRLGATKSTKRLYTSVLNAFNLWLLKKRRKTWGENEIQAYLAQCLDKGLEASSVKTYGTVLKAFALYHDRPVTKIKLPRIRRKIRPIIRQNDYPRVLAAPTNDRDKLMLYWFLYLGLRVKEAANIRIRDIMAPERTLLVTHVGAKGKKERLVPFEQTTFKMTQLYILKYQLKADDSLFNIQERRILDVVKYWVAFAGVKDAEKLSPHRLRASALNYWRRQGVDVESIRLLAGHEDIRTTQGYFSGLVEEAIEDFRKVIL